MPVIRPQVAETTALGAAYAAGLAVGFWGTVDDLRAELGEGQGVDAEDGSRPSARRSTHFWKKAVTRTFDWVEH